MSKTKATMMIAILTVIAFIIIRALYGGAGGPNCCGTALVCDNETGVITGTCGACICLNETENATGCSYGGNSYLINDTVTGPCRDCWSGAECTILQTLLPLIIVLAGLTLMVWNIIRKGSEE